MGSCRLTRRGEFSAPERSDAQCKVLPVQQSGDGKATELNFRLVYSPGREGSREDDDERSGGVVAWWHVMVMGIMAVMDGDDRGRAVTILNKRLVTTRVHETPKATPPVSPSGGARRDSAPGLALSRRALVEAAPGQRLSLE